MVIRFLILCKYTLYISFLQQFGQICSKKKAQTHSLGPTHCVVESLLTRQLTVSPQKLVKHRAICILLPQRSSDI